jgi:hypothetical protein
MMTASLMHAGFRIPFSGKLGLAVGVLCLGLLSTEFYTAKGIAQVLLIGTVFCVLSSGNTVLGILKMKCVRRLGEISYSVYLLHGLVLSGVFAIDPVRDFGMQNNGHYWLVVALCGVLVIFVASLSYLLVERPGIDLGRNGRGSRRGCGRVARAGRASAAAAAAVDVASYHRYQRGQRCAPSRYGERQGRPPPRRDTRAIGFERREKRAPVVRRAAGARGGKFGAARFQPCDGFDVQSDPVRILAVRMMDESAGRAQEKRRGQCHQQYFFPAIHARPAFSAQHGAARLDDANCAATGLTRLRRLRRPRISEAAAPRAVEAGPSVSAPNPDVRAAILC